MIQAKGDGDDRYKYYRCERTNSGDDCLTAAVSGSSIE